MLAAIKKFIFAIILVFGGVLIFGLYYEYGIAAGITPAIGGGAIYIWWQFYKGKNPAPKESPDISTTEKVLSDSDKKKIVNDPDINRIIKEFRIKNIFKNNCDN